MLGTLCLLNTLPHTPWHTQPAPYLPSLHWVRVLGAWGVGVSQSVGGMCLDPGSKSLSPWISLRLHREIFGHLKLTRTFAQGLCCALAPILHPAVRNWPGSRGQVYPDVSVVILNLRICHVRIGSNPLKLSLGCTKSVVPPHRVKTPNEDSYFLVFLYQISLP